MNTFCSFVGRIFGAAICCVVINASAQANLPRPKEENSSSTNGFSPVQEVVLTNSAALGFASDKAENRGLDQPAKLIANFAREEFDAGDFQYVVGDGFYCVDVKLIKLAAENWSNLEANRLAAALDASVRDSISPKFQAESSEAVKYGFQVYHKTLKLAAPASNVVAVYGFRTFHGVTGLLQIVSPSNNSAGLLVRYKLLQR
jgi:hypothetical protein